MIKQHSQIIVDYLNNADFITQWSSLYSLPAATVISSFDPIKRVCFYKLVIVPVMEISPQRLFLNNAFPSFIHVDIEEDNIINVPDFKYEVDGQEWTATCLVISLNKMLASIQKGVLDNLNQYNVLDEKYVELLSDISEVFNKFNDDLKIIYQSTINQSVAGLKLMGYSAEIDRLRSNVYQLLMARIRQTILYHPDFTFQNYQEMMEQERYTDIYPIWKEILDSYMTADDAQLQLYWSTLISTVYDRVSERIVVNKEISEYIVSVIEKHFGNIE